MRTRRAPICVVTGKRKCDLTIGAMVILVIEDGEAIQKALAQHFVAADVRVEAARSAGSIVGKIRQGHCDLVIWDADVARAERAKGVEALSAVVNEEPATQIIVVSSGLGDPALARILSENYHYVQRPIEAKKLCALVSRALEKSTVAQQILAYPATRVPLAFEGMLASSLPMREVFQRINEAASEDLPVLITGETGTGKDLVAAAIHNRSKRKSQPYVPVNTGAIAPELIASELFGHEKGAYTGAAGLHHGYFEQADHGTIFLDEIGTMDERLQMSLLRVLEMKTFRRVGGERDVSVDVRIITATNDDLEEAVKEKRFRQDLFYRLDVFRIHLPPLRDRFGAVSLLTDHYVNVFNSAYKKNLRAVSQETYRDLRRYPWPGNVRELKNVIQRAVLMSQGHELTPDLLPSRIRETPVVDVKSELSPIRVGMTLDAVEKEMITMTLASTGGNKKQAADILGITRRSLYNKLARYGLV